MRLVKTHKLTGMLMSAHLAQMFPLSDSQAREVEIRLMHEMVHVLELDHLLVMVCSALDAAHVDFRVLKGVSQARTLYDDPAQRPYSDIDLLVRGSQFAEALSVLAEMGLHRPQRELHHGYDARFGKGATLRTATGRGVDLHRTLLAGPYAMLVDATALFGHEEFVTVGGHTLPTLSATDRFVHSCFSAVLSDSHPSLLALREVCLGVPDSAYETRTLLGRAKAWQARAVVAAAVSLAWTTLGPTESPPLLAWSSGYRPTMPERLAMWAYRGKRHRWSRQAWVAVPFVKGVRPKFDYVRAITFPQRPLQVRSGHEVESSEGLAS